MSRRLQQSLLLWLMLATLLNEINTAIPPLEREVLTLKHSAIFAQLLMDEVHFGESAPSGSQEHSVFLNAGHVWPWSADTWRTHQITCPSLGTTYMFSSRICGLRLRVLTDEPALTFSAGP